MHRRKIQGGTTGFLPQSQGPSTGGSNKPSNHFYKRLPVIYRRFGKKEENKIIMSLIGLIALCFLLGFVAPVVLNLLTPKDPYPWKHLSRPANGRFEPTNNPNHPSDASGVYQIPDSDPRVGDKSPFYAELRKTYDARYPPNAQRSLRAVQELRHYSFQPKSPMDQPSNPYYYDIYNCPDQPPKGYPYSWKLLDILHQWPSDDPEHRQEIFQGLCVFDFVKDHAKAMAYRRAEVPFIVQGDPQVASAVERLNMPHYMDSLLGDVAYETEYSESVNFLYWNMMGVDTDTRTTTAGGEWKEPTKVLNMPYNEWFHHANVTDDKLLGPDQPHWYFKLNGCGEHKHCTTVPSECLFDELPFFQPTKSPSLYITDATSQRGIHCRLGMKGVIAQSHFDGGRNAVALLGGQRRYILSHPDQCDKLALYPVGHPSARHSAVNWADPDLEEHPEFAQAYANEVVLQAGDVLYLPTFWFHHIISLSINFQCNTRSGFGEENIQHINQCGYS
jgi:hypothetical protein